MITVSYSGVHQAYQLALAAHEAGHLDRFLCSFYDAPGKWGGRLSKILGPDVLKNRRLNGLGDAQIVEHPWPELGFKLRGRLQKLPSNAWIEVAQAFDQWAATRLARGSSQGVVCTENCALETFRAAGRRGMFRIYDCPGHNAKLLNESANKAAQMTGLKYVTVADTSEVSRAKEFEIALADVVLTYSDFHTQGVVARGVPRDKIAQIPLWTDSEFWKPSESPLEGQQPVKVIFAGGINLRKGVPFLIEAVSSLLPHVHLTLVGHLDSDVLPCLAGTGAFVNVLAPVGKTQLRKMYQTHDLLVLPSLGDSFGFVAMEAMACGLPVVLTSHCGAPVPDEAWRVSAFDSNAIQKRIEFYLDQPDLLVSDRMRAREFAENYTPERYRLCIGELFRSYL